MSTTTRYRLVAPDRSVVVPELDEHQQRVVDHEGGPLLVLAGPGTGKTTTLVEAIVDRIERRGASPDSVLALTFSRKAAEQLRDRVTARVARTTSAGSLSRVARSCEPVPMPTTYRLPDPPTPAASSFGDVIRRRHPASEATA